MKLMLYFALILAAVSAASGRTAVLDSYGDPLSPGTDYYAASVLPGHGGGLTLASRGKELCPVDIIQSQSDLFKGFPIKSSNWWARVDYVPESQDLNIKINVADIFYTQSTFWKIDNFDREKEPWFVTTGPEPSWLGQGSSNSFFRIENHGQNYKFVFCPQRCRTYRNHCNDVGIFIDQNGVQRLSLSDVPFVVKFMKANETKSASTLSM